MNIIQKHIDDSQYYKHENPKSILVLHHTAGGPNPYNVLHGWNFNAERVGTAYVIAGKEDKTKSYKDGDIVEAFDPKYHAYHLGLKTANNLDVTEKSIGIEICNWGQLVKKENKFYNYVNTEASAEEVVTFTSPFRGFLYYHKYTDAQLASLKALILHLCDKFKIDKKFRPEIFDINHTALNGGSGLWTHVSYRSDKNDCSPQPKLIDLLNSL